MYTDWVNEAVFDATGESSAPITTVSTRPSLEFSGVRDLEPVAVDLPLARSASGERLALRGEPVRTGVHPPVPVSVFASLMLPHDDVLDRQEGVVRVPGNLHPVHLRDRHHIDGSISSAQSTRAFEAAVCDPAVDRLPRDPQLRRRLAREQPPFEMGHLCSVDGRRFLLESPRS